MAEKENPPPYPGYAAGPPPPGFVPPPQSGYAPPPQQGGFAPPPQQGGFAPPPQQGGFAPPPQQPYIPPKDGGSYQGQPAPGQQNYTHAASTTVVVAQPAVTVVQTYRESPVRTKCIHCQADVITGVTYEPGTMAWVICCVLFWFFGLLGCCLIPFCVDGCKDVIHTCPNCHQQIARFNRM